MKIYNKKVLLLIIFAIFVTTGCTTSTNTPQTLNNTTSSTLDTTRFPERKAEIFGRVQKIFGNEVTILIAEGQGNNQSNEEALSEQDREKRRAEMQNLSPEERQKQRGALTFTGETKIVIIPVGTPITSSSKINGEEIITELSLADITPGKVFRIWIEGEKDDGEKDDGIQIAEYVRFLPNF